MYSTRRFRAWLRGCVPPTTLYLLQQPERRADLKELIRSIRGTLPHERLYFMIVLPGGLHIADLAYHHVPEDVRLVVILNGTESWEVEWARAHFKEAPVLATRFMYRHHDLLNLLLRDVRQCFGILDYDCFVFRTDLFRAVESLGPRTSASTLFATYNHTLDLWIPETFLMFLNQSVMARMTARYGVGANQIMWEDLPNSARRRLASLGVGQGVGVEAGKHPAFLDTLRAMLLLAKADAHPYNIVMLPGAVPHVGAMARPSRDEAFHNGAVCCGHLINECNAYVLWGRYFWTRRLELAGDSELRDRYFAHYGEQKSEQILSLFSEKPDQETLAFLDTLAAGKLTPTKRPSFAEVEVPRPAAEVT